MSAERMKLGNGATQTAQNPMLFYRGQYIVLPEGAKYVMQEANGVWYWARRKQRIVYCDETHQAIGWGINKWPVFIPGEYSHPKPLITELTAANWMETVQRTLTPELMPNMKFAMGRC